MEKNKQVLKIFIRLTIKIVFCTRFFVTLQPNYIRQNKLKTSFICFCARLFVSLPKQIIVIMTQEEKTRIEERIVDVLKTVYDPEIPVNIYDLGMIYKIDMQEDGTLEMDMTFTAPSCPAADYILEDVRTKVESVEGVKTANVNLVFEPMWDQSMMSEEARVELGFE